MSNRAWFLRAVRAGPEDWALRWAIARRPERPRRPPAAVVRLQCVLEPLRDRYHDKRVEELQQREERMLAEHRAEWLGPLDELVGDYPHLPAHSAFHFRRGLVEGVHLPVQTFLERGDELAE